MNEESKQGAPGGASETRCEPEMLVRLHGLAEEALRGEYHFGEPPYMTLDPGLLIDVLGDLASCRSRLSTAEKERDEALRETNRTFNTMQDRLAEKIDCQQSGTEEACCDCVTCWMDRASDAEERLAALSGSNIEDAPTAPTEIASDSSALEKALGALRALLRLYDWRFELGRREDDARFTEDDPAFRVETLRLLRQYGTEKKAAWAVARTILSGGAHVDGPKALKEEEK